MSNESFPITPEHCVERAETSACQAPDSSVNELCGFVKDRAGNDAIMFAKNNQAFELGANGHNNGISFTDISSIREVGPQTFRSVVLMQVLHSLDHKEANRILQQAWALLKRRGRLFVVEPNKEAREHDARVGCLSVSTLRKMLKPYGRTVRLAEQPFKWVIISVRKRDRTDAAKVSKDRRLKITAELCKGRVLEFGCGRGELTERIHDRGLCVVGVEKNASKIAQARKNCPAIEFVHQDVLKLPFASESFDTVALPEILEHVSESPGDRMLETAWRFLKPGGRLVVSVPNENCVPCRSHVRQFSRKSLAAILSRFGKPYLETRQPYKWLIMYVEKPSSI